jgi:RNA polymerase sigma-70 factor (ECF subfamily)
LSYEIDVDPTRQAGAPNRMTPANGFDAEQGSSTPVEEPVTPADGPPIPTSEEELAASVAAAALGDRTALSMVLKTIQPPVVRYCRSRIGIGERGQVSADDVAQEVCMAVMTALPRYRDQGRPFMSFVYGIAAHKVADARRGAARNRSDPTSDLPERASDDDGPEQRAMTQESHRRVKQLLGSLSPEQREILILRVIEGLTAAEAAELVGSTAGAVRVAQHRALAKLKRQIKEVGETDD